MKWRWTLERKIGGLATVLLLLLGGVSSYFYFEIGEISREIEEIGQSDFPLYETTNQLILYQKEKQLLLEELHYIYDHLQEEQELHLSKISYQFKALEQDINRALSEGIKKSQFALDEEGKKENKIRLNQEQEDYQELKANFFQLELKHQKLNLIIEQLFQQTITPPVTASRSLIKSPEPVNDSSSKALSLSVNLIQEARLELQSIDRLTLEILDQLKTHVNGSVSATASERNLAVKTNALIALISILFGLLFSTWLTKQITSSIKKVTQQAQLVESMGGIILRTSLLDRSVRVS